MTVVRRFLIRGLVQGVGFRYAMAARARQLGITGWVRNRRDGHVEAMVGGDAGQVDAILDWARVGPAGATVDELVVETASGEFSGFEVLPTV